jgi:hypothetical protein
MWGFPLSSPVTALASGVSYAIDKRPLQVRAVLNETICVKWSAVGLISYGPDSIDRPDISQGQCRCASC